MVTDKRMYFVRNIDIPPEDKGEVEYEVTTDSVAFRSYNSPDYTLSTWERPDRKPGVYRKLWLRIQQKSKAAPEDTGSAKPARKGFYHGGGIAEELVALASLFLRARFKLGPIVRFYGAPVIISQEEQILDKAIIKDSVPLDEMEGWIASVVGLKDFLHFDFIIAARFYHRALLYIDTNPVNAYLDLISAVETLSRYSDIGKPRISWLRSTVLEKSLKRIEDKDLRKEVEEAILGLPQIKGFISKNFVQFITDNTKEEFWDANRRDKDLPPNFYVEEEDLEKYLKRIYRIRSEYLHAGMPFPPSIFEPPYKNAELSLGDKTWTSEKLWTKTDFIPLPHFFERLVRHVLINFLKSNQKES